MPNEKREAPGPHIQGTPLRSFNEPADKLPPTIPAGKSARNRALEVAIAALDTARAAVAAVVHAEDEATPEVELLDVQQSLARYGIGRNALLDAAQRGELQLLRGARQRLLVRRGEIERWLTGRTVVPRIRPTRAIADAGSASKTPSETEEEWQRRFDAELAAAPRRER